MATYKVQHLSNWATSDSKNNRNQKQSLATHAAAVTKTRMHIDADWNKSAWKHIRPLVLQHFMGNRPKHLPRTQAKLLYDDKALYVIFRVKDFCVRAISKEHQDHVYLDSCVEFFFAPEDPTEKSYFNLEMNCGGTMLLHYQTIPRKVPLKLTKQEIARIEVAHSQPKIIDPEVIEPTTWTVEYRLPFDILKKRSSTFVQPAPGVLWRANFYKCADHTSNPHWLTWARIDHPVPNFHLPQFFGVLEFL
ncbi:MAG: carbohydrate-binding family 9-like protein [Pirellulales bacterium]